MVESVIIFIYILFFISMVCSISLTVKLYMSGKNYLIAVLAAGMALCELIVFSGIIWIQDFEANVPKRFCIFQGIALQYSIYLQIISALCFSIYIYQLLVCRNRGTAQRKIYIGCIVGIPIVMTIIVAVVSVPADAIQPFALNCDVKDPVWIRLIGYSGFNFALTIAGVYLSARATYEVFKHLDQFKTYISSKGTNSSNTSGSNNNTNVEATAITATEASKQLEGQDNLQNQIKFYNMTRTAAIRMVLFSSGFALINLTASIQTILHLIKGDPYESKGLRGNDYVGALMGTIIYLVFGLPCGVTKFFCGSTTSIKPGPFPSEDS